ncbi:MAG: SPOR domain-containing protein [SAR324 cluster bacterium]|nr:SPOR domain-containing protein [SAR324 cluster bacterium]
MFKKSSTHNRHKIVLETNGVFILSFLFFISSGLVFYLGISYGKSTRTAQEQKAVTKIESTSSQLDVDRLAILNLGKNSDSLKDYKHKLSLIDKSLAIPNSVFKELPQKTVKPKNILPKVASNMNFADLSFSVKNLALNQQKLNQASAINNTDNDITNSELFTIQVAAMKDKDRASRLLKQLRDSKFDSYIVAKPTDNDDIIYRIRVGSSLTKLEAKELLPTLEKEFSGLSVPSIQKYLSY